jgi:hypothetical protein
MTEVAHSLRRLGTDYIDLYQIHRNDHSTPLEETLEALHELLKTGKVRYPGASSMPAWEFAKALHLQHEHGWARFASMQDHYNLLAREEEREMIPLCLDEGVGTIVRSPLAQGRLARPWDDAKATARSGNDGFADMLYTPATADSDRAIIDAVGHIADARGVSGRRSRSPGSAASPSSPRRSSGPAQRSKSTTPSGPSTSRSPTTKSVLWRRPTPPATTCKASATTTNSRRSWPASPSSPRPDTTDSGKPAGCG